LDTVCRYCLKNPLSNEISKELKLFVWTESCPDSLAFAIAKDETEARELIIKEIGYDTYYWGFLKILPLNEKCAYAVSGGG